MYVSDFVITTYDTVKGKREKKGKSMIQGQILEIQK